MREEEVVEKVVEEEEEVVEKVEEGLEEDTYGDDIPPSTLPHTKKSRGKAERVPIFITDEILAEEKGEMEEDRPLFVSPSDLSLTAEENSNILQSLKRRVSSVLDITGRREPTQSQQEEDVEKSSNNFLAIPQS